MFKTLKDVDVKGRHVMVRAGLDVPFDIRKDLLDPGRVTDDSRIMDILQTIRYLIKKNAKIVLAAGWAGRPKGADPDYSLAPVAKRIEKILKTEGLLRHPVLIAPNCYDDKKPKSAYKNKEEVASIVKSLKDGQVVVLENVRYDPEANANDKGFAEFIASLAEIYVNENETQNHRKEATVVTTPLLIAKKGGEVVYGFKYAEVLEKIGSLRGKIRNKNRGHFVFGLCGKKIETDPGITSKMTMAMDLLDVMKEGDVIITGGAVSYTFLLAKNYEERIEPKLEELKRVVSKYDAKIISQTEKMTDKKKAEELTAELQKQKSEELKRLAGITEGEIKELLGESYIRWGQEGEQVFFAHNLIAKAKLKGVQVITADDHTIADSTPDKFGTLPKRAKLKIYERQVGIPEGWLAVGEGPKTLEKLAGIIEKAGIYLQSGPFSIEDEKVEKVSKTDYMTFKSAKKCRERGGLTIGVGGDTVARIHKRNADDAFSVITNAGGATLELIQTGTSKGKEAVEEARRIRKIA